MSELAIVSARRPRLQAAARRGRAGARMALALAADPGKFLSTVQTGITLIGVVAGAFSGAALGGPVSLRLERLGLSHHAAETWGFGVVIVGTTYLSLVIGELVPKQLALRRPEPIAIVMARPMTWLARATVPFGWALDTSTALIFRLIGLTREREDHVTAEELHLVVAEASSAGVIEESERQIISGVVRLADRPVREVMTPRTAVEWIDADLDPAALRERLVTMPHSRMPVGRGSIDAPLGLVQARDVLAVACTEGPIALAPLLRQAPVVPDQMDAMDALRVLREADVPVGFVHDEYGHFDGIVTPVDLLAAIAGRLRFGCGRGRTIRRWWSAPTAAGWWRAPSRPTSSPIGSGVALPEDRDYATVAGFALFGATPPAHHRRDLRP